MAFGMPSSRYPSSMSEVLQPSITFRAATLEAVCRFGRSRPWNGDLAVRQAKFQVVHDELRLLYRKSTVLMFGVMDGGCSGGSYFSPRRDEIVLVGRLSVVTFLHEWAHVLHGPSEVAACRWSIQLFARSFPRQFERLTTDGHVLRLQA
ncbi:MAG: hypothetical protein QM770_05080 [Tepidisphaeraceae bacterium]